MQDELPALEISVFASQCRANENLHGAQHFQPAVIKNQRSF